MFFAKTIRTANVDETAVLGEARKIIASRIEDPTRRTFLMRSLTLGGVAMLSGCSLGDDDQVESALASISRFNDRVQGWLFDPHVLAPEYPAAMITRPFPFNAFYGIDDVPVVEADTYRLEVTGKVADKRSWSLEALRAMAQVDQITRHICVEGWSAIGRWGGVRFSDFLARIGADTDARYVGFKCADDYYTSIDMATALHPQTLLALTYDGQVLPLRLSHEAAHANQAWLQEPQAHPGNFRHRYLHRRLLGRPGLQLVRWQLSVLRSIQNPAAPCCVFTL